ncbi:YdeI/OmpD-associated family protein [Lunatimonas salinarum]|uniref:YdeI/OmpD-associated family protein n=1 Tax=Lunatimonas salinarum TaxID=1774590 RepID=UPI001AE03BA9|nr:YdeI/OmpD-associated family protein [Lunatimonas salinarum]
MDTLSFASPLLDFHSSLWRYHLPVPDSIANKFIEGDNRRVLVWVENSPKLHLALMKHRDYWFVLINKALVASLSIHEAQTLQVRMEKDRSTYGHEMPVELEEILNQDEAAHDYFHALTMGKQRSLIYLVSNVKNTQSRLNKALAISSHLVEAKGNLDFKQLNEKIKYYNNLGKPFH